MTPEEEHYQGGYVDGIEDSLFAVMRAETIKDAAYAIRKLRGDADCPACNGTGIPQKITQRMILGALMEAAGAHVSMNTHCEICCGTRTLTTIALQKYNAGKPE